MAKARIWMGIAIALGCAALLAMGTVLVQATANGKVGYSGIDGGPTCTTCHSGGAAPSVAITGPTTVVPGVTNLYTLTINGGPGQTGGLNVAVDDGTLLAGLDTRLEAAELTHQAPKDFAGAGEVAFNFAWTAPVPPGSASQVPMQGAGLSSNGEYNSDGDGTGTDAIEITVEDTSAGPSTIALSAIASLEKVTDIQNAGDDRLFIVEQPGRIWIYQGGSLLAQPFLDISGPVDDGGNEMGLLGLAFHPQVATNGTFFVNYTHSLGGTRTTRIARFQVSAADPNVADPSSELVILEFAQPYSNHNGGAIHFGPDGYLYIASGDGGSANDPDDYSQNLGSMLGKLLRIDVDGASPGLPDCDVSGLGNYRIPTDNPLADGAGGACDEIWASGVRNPWRMSFDRETGALWIADVGQWAWEEVDYEPAGDPGGHNYGWDCYEGNRVNTDDPSPQCSTSRAQYTFPVHEYRHESGRCSITGGYVYRGLSYGGLDGHYLFADYCTGELWTLSGDPLAPDLAALSLAPGSSLSLPRTFGQDSDGELYVASDTTVYRLGDPEASAVAPTASISLGPDSGVTLAWDDAAGNCTYEVHEVGGAYLEPDGASTLLHVIPSGQLTAYVVPLATGDPDDNQVYVIRAVNCSGLSVADSSPVAEFDYAVMPGS